MLPANDRPCVTTQRTARSFARCVIDHTDNRHDADRQNPISKIIFAFVQYR